MKNNFLWIALCLCALPTSAQYISIRETDQSGKLHDLTATRQAVDINSQLFIVINQQTIFDSVHAALASEGNQMIDSLIDRLEVYKKYIEKIDAAIIAYAQLYETPGDSIDRTALIKALQARAQAGIAIVKLFPDGSRFKRRREEELSSDRIRNLGSNESFRIIMGLLSDEMQTIESDLLRLRKESGYLFQLGAWSVTKRGPDDLHLDGFDDLPQGEFYEYERNRLYLTPEQKQQLNALSAFFENNERQNVFEKISDILPGLAAHIIDTSVITAQFDQVKEKLNSLVTTAVEEKNKTIEKIKGLEARGKALFGAIKNIHQKYINMDGTVSSDSKLGLLQGFMDDFTGISLQVKALEQEVNATATSINFAALGSGASSLQEEISNLESICKDAANQIINHARETYQLAVYGRRINAAALELSDKVLKLAVNDIPHSTTLDLRYTGKRDPGDLIVIKAMIRKGEDKHPFITEVREYPIMNALQHVHMTVVYAFSKPVIEDSNFKGGPLVSILYKFKSHSLAYRNFFDPGIGLHAASFDFNNDDTPEFAGGVVLSIFKDYLQGGWGFNFNANRGYWFAGLRIPIPTAPVSLMGS